MYSFDLFSWFLSHTVRLSAQTCSFDLFSWFLSYTVRPLGAPGQWVPSKTFRCFWTNVHLGLLKILPQAPMPPIHIEPVHVNEGHV